MEADLPRTTQAMSEEQLAALLAKLKNDGGLQEKLKAAGDADAVVAIAKAAGFVISADELARAQAEVSEEKLEEGVTGGTCSPLPTLVPYCPTV